MAKIGRPRKAKGEVRAEVLTMRLTKAEKRAVEAAAKKAGVSAGEWARAALVASVRALAPQ